jgi:2-polyprenyl-6-methoxyphenol hydroxylase-like FAD-dependent oxidoreductase
MCNPNPVPIGNESQNSNSVFGAQFVSVKVPVLIVGAGPIGLALAGDLAWRGIKCMLIERTDGAITQPKMDLIGPRTMEFCRRWGIADQVRDCPYNADQPQDNVWLQSLTGFEFGREVFPAPRDAKPPPQSPVRRERCPQDMFDPILRKWVESLPAATLCYHTELVSFEESASGVTANLKTADGTIKTVEADYLVGADGGGSLVRQALGIEMAGKPALTYTTNVIFRCRGFWDLHDKKKGYRFIFIGPEGTWATLVAIDGYDRFRFSIVGDETKRTLEEDDVRKLIVRAMGKDFDFEVLSIVPWVRRELVANSYGAGRVFIAGDAAHLNSPTGAFGMNTGMQDSVDLGWKLAAMVQGWGGRSLMASYQVERRPVALRNVEEASENLRRMLSPRAKLSPLVFAAGIEAEAARKEFGDAYTEMMKREWFTLHIHLGYIYENSPIICPDGTPSPNDPVMTYNQTSRPGSRAPHIWLSPDFSTLDLYGREFVLLSFDGNQDCTPFEEAAARSGVPFKIVVLTDPAAARLYSSKLVLVRPDGFVGWRSDVMPADPSAVIDVVRGEVAEVMDTSKRGSGSHGAGPRVVKASVSETI